MRECEKKRKFMEEKTEKRERGESEEKQDMCKRR